MMVWYEGVDEVVKLRQRDNPADKASWTEHFYDGKVKVTNGTVDTDNLVYVGLLQQRGFRIVDDAAAADDSESRAEELEALVDAVKNGHTDEVPEQEIVPQGDANLEGKVDLGEDSVDAQREAAEEAQAEKERQQEEAAAQAKAAEKVAAKERAEAKADADKAKAEKAKAVEAEAAKADAAKAEAARVEEEKRTRKKAETEKVDVEKGS